MEAVTASPKAGLSALNTTLGALVVDSERLVAPCCSIAAPVSAVIAIGVSCSFCSRNCAVTTTSLFAAPVSAGAAVAAPAAWPPAAGAPDCASAGEASAIAAMEAPTIKDERVRARAGAYAIDPLP